LLFLRGKFFKHAGRAFSSLGFQVNMAFTWMSSEVILLTPAGWLRGKTKRQTFDGASPQLS
jgi:hypothetical protein